VIVFPLQKSNFFLDLSWCEEVTFDEMTMNNTLSSICIVKLAETTVRE